jgi:hypothetical protein
MMLLKGFSRAHLSKAATAHNQISNATKMAVQSRGYFNFVDKIRDKLYKPWRHFQSFNEPDGINYESQLPEGYRLHGNSAASFSAHLTKNSIELNQWHEMESVVHT